MYKYFNILFTLICVSFATPVFAWVDTDKICNWEQVSQHISVNYPGKNTQVLNVLNDGNQYHNPWNLYYVVNIYNAIDNTPETSELYSYDCDKKKAKKLWEVSMKNKRYPDTFNVNNRIDWLNNGVNLLIVQSMGGMLSGDIETLTVFDLTTNKVAFQVNNIFNANGWWTLPPDSDIDWFWEGKNHWKFEFSWGMCWGAPWCPESWSMSDKTFWIHKKTKKIIEF